jgi:hypothetical protein
MDQLKVDARPFCVIAAGGQGSGKSSASILYLLNADLSARFLFDPSGEYSQRLKIPAIGFNDPAAVAAAIASGWIVFDPHILFPGRMADAFKFFCDWAFAKSAEIPGRKLILIDEAWKYCSPSAIPAELATIVQTGRKLELGAWFSTQQPQKLNGSIIGEATEAILFRLQFARSLDLARDMGFNPEEIAALSPLSFVARNLHSGGEIRGSITF